MATTKEVEKAKRVKVKLNKVHEHGGKLYEPNQEIDVLPHQKAWLEQLGKVDKPTQKEGQ